MYPSLYVPSGSPSHRLSLSLHPLLKPRAPSKGPPPPRPRSGTRVREERRRAGLATGEGSARKCAAPQGSLAPGHWAANPPASTPLQPWSVRQVSVPAQGAAREKDVPAPPRSRLLPWDGCPPTTKGRPGLPSYRAPAGSWALLQSACAGTREAKGVRGNTPSSQPPR